MFISIEKKKKKKEDEPQIILSTPSGSEKPLQIIIILDQVMSLMIWDDQQSSKIMLGI